MCYQYFIMNRKKNCQRESKCLAFNKLFKNIDFGESIGEQIGGDWAEITQKREIMGKEKEKPIP